MSELNESTETSTEFIMDSVKEDRAERDTPTWHSWVGMSTLLMALLTAIGALLAGISAHEALLERTEEIIAVATCQGDRATIEVLKSKHEIQRNLGETPDLAEVAQIQAYEAEVAKLEGEARRDEEIVQSIIYPHIVFAIAVTLLAVGTSLGGMAIILEQRLLWYAGIVFGLVGAIGVVTGVAMMIVR